MITAAAFGCKDSVAQTRESLALGRSQTQPLVSKEVFVCIHSQSPVGNGRQVLYSSSEGASEMLDVYDFVAAPMWDAERVFTEWLKANSTEPVAKFSLAA